MIKSGLFLCDLGAGAPNMGGFIRLGSFLKTKFRSHTWTSGFPRVPGPPIESYWLNRVSFAVLLIPSGTTSGRGGRIYLLCSRKWAKDEKGEPNSKLGSTRSDLQLKKPMESKCENGRFVTHSLPYLEWR